MKRIEKNKTEIYPGKLFIFFSCTEVDNLSADVRVGSRLSRIDEWCGKRAPPNLMSSSNLLQLEYNTKVSVELICNFTSKVFDSIKIEL